MFNKEFYPTPPEVIELMLSHIDVYDKVILEPSAGKGDIVSALYLEGAKSVLTCEKNEDLAKIVAAKSSLIGGDFFDVGPDQISHVDAIIMNPPFSNAEKHIEHAWEIAPAGCTIIALCNTETVANDYTYSRKRLASIIENNGVTEILGNVFSTSERSTEVSVNLVQLFKAGSKENFEEYFDYSEEHEDGSNAGIMPHNAVRECVQRYVGALKQYDNVVESAIAMENLASVFDVGDITFTCTVDNAQTKREEFHKSLQKKAWGWVFHKMNMGKYMTQSLRTEINTIVEQQKKVPFTMTNIFRMVQMVVGTHGNRMDKVIVEVAERLTKHYHENRYQVEGWKTNSHFMVGKKFILPFVVKQGYRDNMTCQIGSRNAELFDDLQKAISFMMGEDYDQTSQRIYSFLSRDRKEEVAKFSTWYQLGYFEFKGYKKGTIHVRFKDDNVWARLNQKIAQLNDFPLPEWINKEAA